MKQLVVLFFFPFIISGLEDLIDIVFLTIFSSQSLYFSIIKYLLISCLLIWFLIRLGYKHLITIKKSYTKIVYWCLLGWVLSLSIILYTLKLHQLLTLNWIFTLILWSLIVFREELVLRGIVQTKSDLILTNKYLKISQSIIFTTVVFTLWHSINLENWDTQVVLIQILASVPAGIIFGLIREKTETFIISYLIHIAADFTFWSLYLIIFSKPLFTF